MKKINVSLLCGGLSGFLAIALGAYADHMLKPHLPPEAYDSLQTALRYQLLHAAVLAGIGLALAAGVPVRMARWLHLTTLFFIAGTLLFCGGIFAAKTGLYEEALRLAPAGGVAFMLGWAVLAVAAMAGRKP